MEAALASSLPSHGSKPAAAAACAVAAAVAAGVAGGYSPAEVLGAAYDAAVFGEKHGAEITAPSVSKRIRMAEYIVDAAGETDIRNIIERAGWNFRSEYVRLRIGAFNVGNFLCGGRQCERWYPGRCQCGRRCGHQRRYLRKYLRRFIPGRKLFRRNGASGSRKRAASIFAVRRRN